VALIFYNAYVLRNMKTARASRGHAVDCSVSLPPRCGACKRQSTANAKDSR